MDHWASWSFPREARPVDNTGFWGATPTGVIVSVARLVLIIWVCTVVAIASHKEMGTHQYIYTDLIREADDIHKTRDEG